MFPTYAEINDIRANLKYGIIMPDRKEFLFREKFAPIENENIIVINNDNYWSREKINTFNIIKKINFNTLNELDPNLDIYVNQLMFQPPKKYCGFIARKVFYFYLMYAYDLSLRPYKNMMTENGTFYPWFINIDDQNACKGFEKYKWDLFFLNQLNTYYKWARDNVITENETFENQKIIQEFAVPNIFVGYYSNDNGKSIYVQSNFDIIDELLFGKKHSHDKYINIQFTPYLSKCEYNLDLEEEKTIFYIENRVFNKLSNDKCFNTINTKNKISKTFSLPNEIINQIGVIPIIRLEDNINNKIINQTNLTNTNLMYINKSKINIINFILPNINKKIMTLQNELNKMMILQNELNIKKKVNNINLSKEKLRKLINTYDIEIKNEIQSLKIVGQNLKKFTEIEKQINEIKKELDNINKQKLNIINLEQINEINNKIDLITKNNNIELLKNVEQNLKESEIVKDFRVVELDKIKNEFDNINPQKINIVLPMLITKFNEIIMKDIQSLNIIEQHLKEFSIIENQKAGNKKKYYNKYIKYKIKNAFL
jgi:hypothetical protein